MERMVEKRIREEWSFFKVEGDEAIKNWLEGLPSWTKLSHYDLVYFFNFKLMHGRKDTKFFGFSWLSGS